MDAIFNLKRDHFGQDKKKRETTLGLMFDPNGDEFCKILEDVVRPYGIKSKKFTAIPATEDDFTYNLTVEQSPTYGKVVTVWTHWEIIDGINTPVLEYGGIRFTWIRCHGGNHADHTDGCLLTNKNRNVEAMSAWGSMKEEFAELVENLEKEGYSCKLRVTNLTQSA